MKKAEFIKEIIEGYSWSPGEKLEFSKEALRLLLIIVLNEAKNLEDVGGTGKISFIPASIMPNEKKLDSIISNLTIDLMRETSKHMTKNGSLEISESICEETVRKAVKKGYLKALEDVKANYILKDNEREIK